MNFKFFLIFFAFFYQINFAHAKLINNWNAYVNAYYDGHDYCFDKWMQVGDFDANPKVLLDIEKCTYRQDVKALKKYAGNSVSQRMFDLIHKKHIELLELAGDATLDAVNYDRRAAINRFLIYRDQILEDYFYILRSIASQ
tara:strand:+ start:111 stop:533 length:423 start_codon:yes stop_codon:yes gene_type:complete